MQTYTSQPQANTASLNSSQRRQFHSFVGGRVFVLPVSSWKHCLTFSDYSEPLSLFPQSMMYQNCHFRMKTQHLAHKKSIDLTRLCHLGKRVTVLIGALSRHRNAAWRFSCWNRTTTVLLMLCCLVRIPLSLCIHRNVQEPFRLVLSAVWLQG